VKSCGLTVDNYELEGEMVWTNSGYWMQIIHFSRIIAGQVTQKAEVACGLKFIEES
jgi:hypothetical protein